MVEEHILYQMSAQLGRLEGKLDGMLSEQTRLSEYANTTSARVSALEQSFSRMVGWVSAIAAFVGGASSLVLEWISGKL
jgi:hypothetical protein